MNDLISCVKQLCAINGVSSREERIRALIRTQAEAFADRISTDSMGNLLVFKHGRKTSGHKLLLAAHMDEVGLIITDITDDGYLKFAAVGSIDRRVLIGKPVQVGDRLIPGVIGLKAYHLVSSEEEKSVPKLSEFYIDIGAENRACAEKMVSLGDCACFVSDPLEFGDDCIKARALGGRIGCAVLLALLREELPMDITFVFTAQAEVGARGALAAAFSVTPDMALILDGSPAADLMDRSESQQVCALGAGPVIAAIDAASIADRTLFDAARTSAKKLCIPWQISRSAAGVNDASAYQRAKTGVKTLVIGTPVRYLRAPTSVAKVQDIDNLLKLVRQFIADQAERR